MNKRQIKIFSFLLIFLATTVIIAKDKVTKGYKLFKGAYFDIEYPTNFKPHFGGKKVSKDEPVDSTYFTSPDSAVEFFIFSPLWSGDVDYTEMKLGEKLKEEKETNENGYINTWKTFVAKDGSYTRSFHMIYHPDYNTKKIYGIQFQSSKAYDKYKKEYLHFKKSHKQYAD